MIPLENFFRVWRLRSNPTGLGGAGPGVLGKAFPVVDMCEGRWIATNIARPSKLQEEEGARHLFDCGSELVFL